jgi:predicted AAA+ superfamily ATPase
LARRSPEFGEAFESYIFHELSTYIDYTDASIPLGYWRSTSNFEVDFILADTTAIEARAKNPVGERDLRGLRALKEENLLKRYIVASLELRPRKVDGIEILPWDHFLKILSDGALV